MFKDTAENPATLTSENVAVTKDADNDGNDIQAFSGQITAANDGENNSKLSVTGDTPMVMKFRMKTDAVDSSDTYLMGKMDNQYGIQINSSKIAFYSCNSDNSWPEVNFAVPDDFGQWAEVVAVYTGSSMKLFVDGKEGSVTSGRPSAQNGLVLITVPLQWDIMLQNKTAMEAIRECIMENLQMLHFTAAVMQLHQMHLTIQLWHLWRTELKF